ncbi:DNA-3-methyladenine glycosylase [Luteipulveratus sp. YIM 133132]|uniref:DNA-3-methyladenine glycosylase n=1 Tax=Luteipulveratus flavus TaxID=3031728 RepID=UPI0023AF5428|nr:DNA-3-methyladenine glycosylase [Luteipulveratus sp. YIM 133132]MDE9367442.1 DNA-3-methyladenine glycosylase [Luteipulveratus sp. YIM 133132]
MERLQPSFYDRSVLQVAPDLLGCLVSHAGVTIRLTEVEAYDGANDPGSHAFRGRTSRNASMFGPPGTLYTYFTYGMHWCANLGCGPEGVARAVLLRAGEVVEGLDVARERRNGIGDRDLARGPARLAQALGLGRDQDGIVTTAPDAAVAVAPRAGEAGVVRTGPRVGVSGAGGDATSYPWRFWLDGESTVSVYRPAKPRRRPDG